MFKNMNRQNKLALIIAPFLMLGGYILSDTYLANKAEVYQLVTTGTCDALNNQCQLESGKLQIRLTDTKGKLDLLANHPLDRVTLFVVDKSGQSTPIQMAMQEKANRWYRQTPLREWVKQGQSDGVLRIIVEIGADKYISEFKTLVI